MKQIFRNSIFQITVTLLLGFGLGLVYSWLISPVTYVDASPALLRTDFKDQYRVVIAASYAATHNLPRARARLETLGDADPVGELSAQAQRMLASGETLEKVSPLAQLATDLQQGFVATSFTNTPVAPVTETINLATPFIEETFPTETLAPEEPTLAIVETPFAPQTVFTPTARPTFTAIPAPGSPFSLVGQDTVCDSSIPAGLLQVMLMDSRRRQIPGIELIVSWDQNEDHFYTGLKPELGNGYADFIMKVDTIYSLRVVEGGTLVPNLVAPTCTDPNGVNYLGGLLLTFQQP
ncbi:MAG: hypothetical protein U0Z26_03945 [Anaerolineales bacterium]